MLIARQTGKSYLLGILATEACLKQPNAVVKFVTPKQRTGKNIIKKTMRAILEDCPPEIKPQWKEADKVFVFPNGSEIQLAGSDNKNYDNIRGGTCDLWIVDEAGFCDDLETVVYSVLAPTTTMTKGRGILSSTPDPDDPEHDFIKKFVEPAKLKDKLFKYTLHENPQLTKAEIQEIIDRYVGGEKNAKFRAEYLCEIVRNIENTVIPEFTDEVEAEIVREWEKPKFFDTYLAMDIGGKDFTVVLFAYYDFLNNKLIIEDEFVMRDKQNTETIAKNVNNKCQTLWDEKPPYLMFADNNNIILLNDLRLYHGLNFIPTRKDNKEAQINQVRLKIQRGEIIINPRCKTLIAHIKHASWAKSNKNGYKQFAHGSDGGHYDALDALIYLVRNVVFGKNPYPSGYGGITSDTGFIRKEPESGFDAIAKIFKIRKSLKN